MAPLESQQMRLLLKKKGPGLFSTGIVLAQDEVAHLVLTKVPQRILYATGVETKRDVVVDKPDFDPDDRSKALFLLPIVTLWHHVSVRDLDPQKLERDLYEKEDRFLSNLGWIGDRHLFFRSIWHCDRVDDVYNFSRQVAAARMFR